MMHDEPHNAEDRQVAESLGSLARPARAPRGGEQAMTRRLGEHVQRLAGDSEQATTTRRDLTRGRPVPLRGRAYRWRFAAAVALGGILGALATWLWLDGATGEPTLDASPGGNAAMRALVPSRHVAEVHLAALAEANTLLDGQAAWVALSPGSEDLGVADAPVPDQGYLVQARLAVVQGDTLLTEGDLLLVPGQHVAWQVPLPSGQRARCHLLASTDGARSLSIWIEAGEAAVVGGSIRLKQADAAPIGAVRLNGEQRQIVLGYRVIEPDRRSGGVQ